MPDPMELVPQAARTIEGLRDTGYEPADALEDIVDNSIAANATEVVIRVWMTPAGEPLVTVADNGHGMDEAGIDQRNDIRVSRPSKSGKLGQVWTRP